MLAINDSANRNSKPSRDFLLSDTRHTPAAATRPVARYSFRTPQGKKESVPVITQYYPKQIVYPLAKIDKHIDRKLMQAATTVREEEFVARPGPHCDRCTFQAICPTQTAGSVLS